MELIERYANGTALVKQGMSYNILPKEEVNVLFSMREIGFTQAHSHTYNAGAEVVAVQTNKNQTNEKGNNKMKANLKEMFKVEKLVNGEVALTMNGAVAVKRKNGDYVNYDVEQQQIVNSAEFVLTGMDKFIIALPTPTIAEGDVIKTKGAFVHVVSVTDKAIKGINLETGTTTNIIKEKNIFGFEFFQKITNMASVFGQTQQDGQAPMFNPMMLMLMDDDRDIDPMMLMMLMGGGQQTGGFNPMMFALMSDKDIDPMLIMAMNGGFKF